MKRNEIYDLYNKMAQEAMEKHYEVINEKLYDFRKDCADINYATKMFEKRMSEIEEMIRQHALGVAKVYEEMITIKNKLNIENIDKRMDELNSMLDKVKRFMNVENIDLNISSYPMSTKIKFIIKTNFGSIMSVFDFSPTQEYRIGEVIQECFDSRLEQLYKAHEVRGGKFMGEVGCKDWFDKNGSTDIDGA